MTIVLFVGGLLFLIVGAEILVRGASRLAALLGVPSLIIGLTVVAFGTSSPELAVSLKSALSDQANIAVGNVVGSNIFNVLFILGLSALIVPLAVSRQLIRLDVPIMILVSGVVYGFALNGTLGRGEGAVLVVGLIAYLGYLLRAGRREGRPEEETVAAGDHGAGVWIGNLVLIGAGLLLLVVGSRWLVDSAVVFARSLGVSELIVGLTIVAMGTSMPEVVTSTIAAFRGERDIAVGNVVGSNLFNLMAVLGIASVVAPGGMPVSPEAIEFDLPAMVAIAVACLPIFVTGGEINRWEGALFLGYYCAYTAYLVLSATGSPSLPTYRSAMLFVVIPAVAVILVITTVQHFRTTHRPTPR